MVSERGRPILVTGCHRSGSTWVGQMIASHPGVGYVHEPFNPVYQPACPVTHQWHYVTAEDEARFVPYLRRQLALPQSWWREVRARPDARRLAGATVRALQAWRLRLAGARPLLKDPIALFSAEWLADTFGMEVVVVIRHPVAVAGSLKRLGSYFPFRCLLGQPRLLQAHLASFEDEIRRLQQRPPDVVEHAALTWRVLHHVILGYRLRRPDWVFVRHEDLSLHPVAEFRALLGRVGLDFPPRVKRVVEHFTGEGNAGDPPVGDLRRDSRANLWNWTHRLTPAEVARVRAATEDLARVFYPEADWWAAPGRQRASA
jgi:hypothetical protein